MQIFRYLKEAVIQKSSPVHVLWYLSRNFGQLLKPNIYTVDANDIHHLFALI